MARAQTSEAEVRLIFSTQSRLNSSINENGYGSISEEEVQDINHKGQEFGHNLGRQRNLIQNDKN